jgi:hypothetical protein
VSGDTAAEAKRQRLITAWSALRVPSETCGPDEAWDRIATRALNTDRLEPEKLRRQLEALDVLLRELPAIRQRLASLNIVG